MKSVLDDQSDGTSRTFPVASPGAFRISASVLQSMGDVAIEAHPSEHYLLVAGPIDIREDATDLSQWIPQADPQARFLGAVWFSSAGPNETQIIFEAKQDSFLVGNDASAVREAFFAGFKKSLKLYEKGETLPGIREEGGHLYSTSGPRKWPNEPDQYFIVNGLDRAETDILRTTSTGESLSRIPVRISRSGFNPADVITGRQILYPGHDQVTISGPRQEPKGTTYQLQRSPWGLSLSGFMSSAPFPSLPFAAVGLNYAVTDWMMLDWMIGFSLPPTNGSATIDTTTGPGFELMPYRFAVGLGRVLGPTIGLGYYHYTRTQDNSAFGVTGPNFLATDIGVLCILTGGNDHIFGVQAGINGSVLPDTPFQPFFRIYFNPF